MNKIFTLIIALVASMSCSYAQQSNSIQKKRIEIEKENVTTDEDFERSLFMPMIEAYYYPATSEVEIELYEIGEANVYIVDTYGQIVDETVVDTDMPTTIFLDASLCVGYFYVVIYSNVVNAEGFVQIE